MKTQRTTKTIAIMNEKGGVGKTATATTLSYILARKGYRTLLVDFDGQAHSTIINGVNPNTAEITIFNLLSHLIADEPLPYPDSYIIRKEGKPDLIPANSRLFTLERTLCNIDFRETKLSEYVATIEDRYDYIIIDCMPQMGTPMVNVMMAANHIIIPTQAELLSVSGLSELIKHYNIIKKNGNPGLAIDGILVTMNNSRANLSATVRNMLRTNFDIRVFDTVIPRSIKVGEGCLHMQNICEFMPDNPAAKAYMAFVEEWMGGDGNGLDS